MDPIYDTIGTMILLSIVAIVVLIPFIGIMRGIMIPKTWGQVEVTVTGHEFYRGGGDMRTRSTAQGSARIHIKYTIDGSVYEGFYYKGRSRHHILPRVGTRETRYYNPENPNKTFSKEDCNSKIRSGIFYILFGCSFMFFIFLILS